MDSYDPNTPWSSLSPPRLSTLQIWLRALTPSVTAYRQLLPQVEGKTWQGYGWVLLAALGSGFVGSCASAIMRTREPAFDASTACIGPLLVVMIIPSLILMTSLTHGVAKTLGGTGHYAPLMHLLAASQAPLLLISSLVGQLPWVGLVLNVGFLFYGCWLCVLAVEAAHALPRGKAIVASLVGNGGNTLLTACVTVFLMALFAPAVEQVYEDTYWEMVATTQPRPLQRFQAAGVSLQYPGSWKVEETNQDEDCQQPELDCLLMLSHPDRSRFILVRGSLPSAMSIKELADLAWDEMQATYPAAEVETYEVLRVSDQLAFRRIASLSGAAFMQVGVIQGQQFYFFNVGSADLKTLRRHEVELDALIASVEFTP